MSVAINLLKVMTSSPSPDFVFTVETTSPSETFDLPAKFAGTYDCDVLWGDATSDTITTYNDAAWTHTYTSAGVYVITIKRTFNLMVFDDLGDKLKIKEINNWGSTVWFWNQMNAYHGCSNLIVSATDVMDVSSVTIMRDMFRDATSANPDVSSWDVSSVTDMRDMFRDATSANPDVSSWDVSSVTIMRGMFRGATSANPDVSSWDVSSVTDMRDMFVGAASANPDVSSWDVSNVTTMLNMFLSATSANPDVSSWDVSNVTTMLQMFLGATSANPDVSSWDVSNVTTMQNMFLSATSFTQTNYDLLLIAWDLLTLQSSVLFGVGTTTYSAGAAATARASIISTYSWTITDGGEA